MHRALAFYTRSVQCVACGELIPEGSRFCPSCGAKVAGHSEERRVVTVLFADLVGFTSLSERRDPEQVKHLVDRCFQLLTAEVVSFGGRVDKIIGDAILALFGAPVAHEDDAERAVRTALRMQEVINERTDEFDGIIRLRVGVNTGEVLVGALAAGGDYTAMGDVVNTASRLQTSANPGEVLVGATTFGATSRVISYEERGVVPTKGRDEPVSAWCALSAVTSPGDRPNRNSGPLVGRDAEVGTLSNVAATALANERASLLVLLGDAGMGKSRIAAETTGQLAAGQQAMVLQGRCLPYGEVNAWWPIADVVRGVLAVDVGEAVDNMRPALRALVSDASVGERSANEVTRIVAGLLGLFGATSTFDDVDPEHVREEIVRSFVALIDDLTTKHPVVLWLSDLHWADPVVNGLVERLLTDLARRPLVVVATARRSLLARWSPPVGRFDTFALNLEALDVASVDELIDQLVAESGRPRLSPATKAVLRERSGGNPLFLVELLSLVQEQSSSTLDVDASLVALPDTLRGLIAARLDNLGVDERAVIDDASVLGRRGKVVHLADMVRETRGMDDLSHPLASLVGRDLIRTDGENWEFTSDLTREVAYGMLTKSDRARRHLGVARWIEQFREGDITDAIADVLAHHYGQAAELLSDLGTIESLSAAAHARGLFWLDQVSARDARLRLFPNVERLCTQAIALAGTQDPVTHLRFLVRRAQNRAMVRNAQGAMDDIVVARAIASSVGDENGLAELALVEGELAQQRGDLDLARSIFSEAAERFRVQSNDERRGEALRSLAMAELFAGRIVQAEQAATQAFELYRSIGRRNGEAWALQSLAWISFAKGDIEQAETFISDSLKKFDETGEAAGLSWARGLQGFVRLAEGNFVAAEALQQSVLATVQANGDRWASAMMLLLASVIKLWTGRTADGVDDAKQGLEIFRAVHDRFGQVRVVWPLARGLAMRGEIDAARGVLAEVGHSGQDEHVAGELADDHFILAVARATVDIHAGNPETVLTLFARLSDEMGLHGVATILTDPNDDEFEVDWVAPALQAGAGIDLLTVIATALMQTNRPKGAERILLATETALGEAGHLAPLHCALAMAASIRGRIDEVERKVALVRADDRATYLDRSFALMACGLGRAAAGDDGARQAFGEARMVVDGTGDLLTQAIVRVAQARAMLATGDSSAQERLDETLIRLREMGTDAHGWVTVFEQCLA